MELNSRFSHTITTLKTESACYFPKRTEQATYREVDVVSSDEIASKELAAAIEKGKVLAYEREGEKFVDITMIIGPAKQTRNHSVLIGSAHLPYAFPAPAVKPPTRTWLEHRAK